MRKRFVLLQLLFVLIITSCSKPIDMVYFDPVFELVSKNAYNNYKSVSKYSLTLPKSDSSSYLFQNIGEKEHKTVLLSPLLSGEIQELLERNENTKVYYAGTKERSEEGNLWQAVFYSKDAASLAAKVIATEQKKKSPDSIVCAVFYEDDSTDIEELERAFLDSFYENGGIGQPIIEIVTEGFSSSLAEKIQKKDISFAYVCTSPSSTEEWLEKAFQDYTFLVCNYPLLPKDTYSKANRIILWDLKQTLKLLTDNKMYPEPCCISGQWKVIKNSIKK